MLADDDVTALLHKTSRILRLVDDDVTQQEDSYSSSGANHVLLLHVWMFSAFACGFTSLKPNSQEVVKKLAKFHKRKNPRFFVTHTRPFQIPNSTALVTTLPATAKQTRRSRRESRGRERERARERERRESEEKRRLKAKEKQTTTVGTFASSFQATIMQKKDFKKQKKECSLSARKGRWNTRDFHKKKQRKKTKKQTRN
jgi:hypothetical protein